MENPIKMDDLGFFPIFLETPVTVQHLFFEAVTVHVLIQEAEDAVDFLFQHPPFDEPPESTGHVSIASRVLSLVHIEGVYCIQATWHRHLPPC